MERALPLADEFLLLALRESNGRLLVDSVTVRAGLGGAFLAELAAAGRIAFDGERVLARDLNPVDDPDLDSMLGRIAGETRPHRPDWWIARLVGSDLVKRRLARLTASGVLDAEAFRILGIIPRTRHSQRDADPEQEIRARLRAALTTGQADERTACLLALAHAAGLTARLSGLTGKALNAQVETITRHDWAGRAADRVITSAALGSLIAT
ncbi:GPP34 family phosphoprotein [Spirillospora sp. NPDC047279]|uniref:GOLPH3/VPS74 family protein n=1 Tax=Spirillospora sp. NPDC047279 TaxID=3155478 RepID=UPI00340374A0